MRLLVTGGAGFIGANFVNYWLRGHAGDQVVVVDKLTYAGNMDRLSACTNDPRFEFVSADIQDYAAMTKAMQGIDCVVHFAAETHVDRSLAGLEAEKLFLRVNVEGTIALLYAAHEAGVKRFHHVSTDEVYGDLPYGVPDKFHEEFPYSPHNPYSISKAAADFAVRSFSRRFALPVTISNCTNNYGPFQTPEKVIPRSISLLLQNKKIELYTAKDGTPGPNVRDWLHVDDHCAAIERILVDGKIGETYCIGGHCELSNFELVKRILSVMSEIAGKSYSMETHVAYVQDRPGHDRRYAMDTAKMEAQLGWRPQHTFETGFTATVKWYTSVQGREWLESLTRATEEVRAGQGRRK